MGVLARQQKLPEKQENMESSEVTSTKAKEEETAKNLELEKFAQDVAETVVTNMEKHGTLNLSSCNQNKMNKVSSTETKYHEEMHEQRQFQQQSFSSTSKMSETKQANQ